MLPTYENGFVAFGGMKLDDYFPYNSPNYIVEYNTQYMNDNLPKFDVNNIIDNNIVNTIGKQSSYAESKFLYKYLDTNGNTLVKPLAIVGHKVEFPFGINAPKPEDIAKFKSLKTNLPIVLSGEGGEILKTILDQITDISVKRLVRDKAIVAKYGKKFIDESQAKMLVKDLYNFSKKNEEINYDEPQIFRCPIVEFYGLPKTSFKYGAYKIPKSQNPPPGLETLDCDDEDYKVVLERVKLRDIYRRKFTAYPTFYVKRIFINTTTISIQIFIDSMYITDFDKTEKMSMAMRHVALQEASKLKVLESAKDFKREQDEEDEETEETSTPLPNPVVIGGEEPQNEEETEEASSPSPPTPPPKLTIRKTAGGRGTVRKFEE